MTQETKAAIKSAEERLENERASMLKEEVYQFLKSELTEIDSLDHRIRELNEQKRVHEENIKNVKSGNLEAIEKRRKALNATWSPLTLTYSNGTNLWYNDVVAGTVVTTSFGKTYIF